MTETTKEVIYDGKLKRGAAENTVEGHLVDGFGWKIYLTGSRNADGTYDLKGYVGDPGAHHIGLTRGEKKADGSV